MAFAPSGGFRFPLFAFGIAEGGALYASLLAVFWANSPDSSPFSADLYASVRHHAGQSLIHAGMGRSGAVFLSEGETGSCGGTAYRLLFCRHELWLVWCLDDFLLRALCRTGKPLLLWAAAVEYSVWFENKGLDSAIVPFFLWLFGWEMACGGVFKETAALFLLCVLSPASTGALGHQGRNLIVHFLPKLWYNFT